MRSVGPAYKAVQMTILYLWVGKMAKDPSSLVLGGGDYRPHGRNRNTTHLRQTAPKRSERDSFAIFPALSDWCAPSPGKMSSSRSVKIRAARALSEHCGARSAHSGAQDTIFRPSHTPLFSPPNFFSKVLIGARAIKAHKRRSDVVVGKSFVPTPSHSYSLCIAGTRGGLEHDDLQRNVDHDTIPPKFINQNATISPGVSVWRVSAMVCHSPHDTLGGCGPAVLNPTHENRQNPGLASQTVLLCIRWTQQTRRDARDVYCRINAARRAANVIHTYIEISSTVMGSFLATENLIRSGRWFITSLPHHRSSVSGVWADCCRRRPSVS
ncbi:hypothetical protein B0H11DRAFT_1917256 [Mycena galericulata]|nr:hypothetical protein B0H11DRAFT_1917256 [Mycena galericulata]